MPISELMEMIVGDIIQIITLPMIRLMEPEMITRNLLMNVKRGIAVILMVFNHATGLNSFAKMYWSGSAPSAQNPWFNVVATHPYSLFNDFNHEYSGTHAQFFKRVLKYWIEEYHVDGYRFDLSKGFTQNKTGSNVANWAKI